MTGRRRVGSADVETGNCGCGSEGGPRWICGHVDVRRPDIEPEIRRSVVVPVELCRLGAARPGMPLPGRSSYVRPRQGYVSRVEVEYPWRESFCRKERGRCGRFLFTLWLFFLPPARLV